MKHAAARIKCSPLAHVCRAYADDNSVGREYDAWTDEGILEAYWGEHIHLGYYHEQARRELCLCPDCASPV